MLKAYPEYLISCESIIPIRPGVGYLSMLIEIFLQTVACNLLMYFQKAFLDNKIRLKRLFVVIN